MPLRDALIDYGNILYSQNNLPANAAAADRTNAAVDSFLTSAKAGVSRFARTVGGHPAAVDYIQNNIQNSRFYTNDPERARRSLLRSAGIYPSTETDDPGAPAPASGASVPRSLDYGEFAPYAQFFGMDAATAYAESLANTAHQREVLDLTRAGLNPVLSATKGAGADVVAGSPGSSGHSGAAVDDAPGIFSGSVISNAVSAAISWALGNKRSAASALGRAGAAIVTNVQASKGKA